MIVTFASHKRPNPSGIGRERRAKTISDISKVIEREWEAAWIYELPSCGSLIDHDKFCHDT